MVFPFGEELFALPFTRTCGVMSCRFSWRLRIGEPFSLCFGFSCFVFGVAADGAEDGASALAPHHAIYHKLILDHVLYAA